MKSKTKSFFLLKLLLFFILYLSNVAAKFQLGLDSKFHSKNSEKTKYTYIKVSYHCVLPHLIHLSHITEKKSVQKYIIYNIKYITYHWMESFSLSDSNALALQRKLHPMYMYTTMLCYVMLGFQIINYVSTDIKIVIFQTEEQRNYRIEP